MKKEKKKGWRGKRHKQEQSRWDKKKRKEDKENVRGRKSETLLSQE